MIGAEQIGLTKRHLLPVPRQQVEELRLQRGAGSVRVEVGDEGIVGLLEDDRRVEARAEARGQRRFADADGAFDRDMAKLQGDPMISSRVRPVEPRSAILSDVN